MAKGFGVCFFFRDLREVCGVDFVVGVSVVAVLFFLDFFDLERVRRGEIPLACCVVIALSTEVLDCLELVSLSASLTVIVSVFETDFGVVIGLGVFFVFFLERVRLGEI